MNDNNATTTTAVSALAGEAYEWFEIAHRYEDEPGRDVEDFTRLREGAPEWVRELVRAAHGEMFPDDWRYESIRLALAWIHDNPGSDLDDMAHEWADQHVDVYTMRLLEWVGSNLVRVGYCDDASEEFGYARGNDPLSLVEIIARGQYMESAEVFGSVLSTLREQVEA